MTAPQRFAAFFRSPHHAWLALLTLGIGLASANVPGMIAAAAAYALGWIFLPDLRWFRRWAERRDEASDVAASAASMAKFDEERAKVYRQLSSAGKKAYDELARAVEDVRASSGGGESPHAGRLGQLAWTYLRLLLTRETLDRFCEKEQSSAIEQEIAEAKAEVEALEVRARTALDRGDATEAGGTERLLQSKRSRLSGLERHLEHVRKAESDLALTGAEIERLFDAVRLIQADLVTRRDPDDLGTEIDRTTAHFHRTRDWLRGLECDQTSPDIPDELTAGIPVRIER